MRRLSIPRPFAGGYKSDVPDYALALNEAAYAQDMVAPIGIARQRWGWKYVGDQSTAGTLGGVARATYPVAGATRTVISTTTNGYVSIHNDSGSATTIWSNPANASTYWIPRCVYNGDLILCAQDGVSPLLRYSGSPSNSTTYLTNSIGMASGSMTITSSVSAATAIGSFASIVACTGSTPSKNPAMSSRIVLVDAGGTAFTVESLRNATTSASSGTTQLSISPMGFAYPCVTVAESGKVTTSGTTATFEGTNFSASSINTTYPQGDALLVQNTTTGNPHEIVDITAVVSATQLTMNRSLTSFSNAAYKVLRRCPFKDATVHRGSLWGTGVSQYPNRVYVFVPTKDIGLPPAAEKPFDPTVQAGYQSASVTGFTRVSDFLAGAYDVPGPYDTAPVVAVLSSQGPLLALKSDSVYGLFGTYDSTNPSGVEVTRISDGAGCIDLRSAVTVKSVPYWAGKDGIYSYRGSITDLTDGRIKREWQSLMAGYVSGQSWVSTGIIGDSYLIISVGALDSTKTGGAKLGPDSDNPSSRTLVYDLRLNVWLGRMTNFSPRHMWTVSVSDASLGLYAVDGATNSGRVLDVAPAFVGGVQSDANGTYPRFKGWTTASLAQADGVEGEARLCDAIFHTNLLDASSPSSQFDVSVVSGGQLDDQATSTKTLTPISADTVDRIDRSKRRVNRSGRLHQIRIDMSSTASTNTKSEIPEIVISLRDSRRGT